MLNLPVSLNTNLLVLVSILLSVVTCLVVVYVFLRVSKALGKEGRALDKDRRIRDELSGEIEEVAKKYAQEIVGTSARKVEAEVDKFASEMARLLHAKSTELSAYIEKAQQDQVKESQFFVANMLSKIEKEAEDYRQNKLKRVDEQIRQIVQSAAREVIGRAISLSEHEDLVVKALERAKKDRVFA